MLSVRPSAALLTQQENANEENNKVWQFKSIEMILYKC